MSSTPLRCCGDRMLWPWGSAAGGLLRTRTRSSRPDDAPARPCFPACLAPHSASASIIRLADQGPSDSMNLLQTKLRIPPVRRELVPRARLHAVLQEGLDRRLILVSAPAGFGKTTVVCDWLETLGLPVAWLSLDEQDNAWPRFLAYLLASLQGIDPAVGAGMLGALESPQRPPLDSLLEALPEELAALRRPFVLVLDDFHVILDPQVHELLTYIIDNQPPGM
ncbi:MAG: hypothetical protein FJZ97_09620, partial [Chloroflexi bacterium]|nr:hypothetical protein [Chloroflexota bacterium]